MYENNDRHFIKIFISFVVLAFWVLYIRQMISGYTGWMSLYLIPIFYILIFLGFILSVVYANNYREKINSLFGKFGKYIFPIMYLSIFFFGFFIWGDNGDGDGGASVASVMLGMNVYTSSLLATWSFWSSILTIIAVIIAPFVYLIKNKLKG